MEFHRIGEKIKILLRMPLRYRDGSPFNVASEGIRSERNGKDFGPPQQTLRGWASGKHLATEEAVARMVAVLNELVDLPNELTVSEFSDDASLLDFMRAIGMDTARGDRFLNALWAEQHVAPAYALAESTRTAVFERTYTGLYRVVRAPLNGADANVETLHLTITCVAPVSTRNTERRSFVACQLAVPGSNGIIYRYRGTFTRNTSVMTWDFTQEDSDEPDRIVMMTDKGDFLVKTPLSGHMLTATEGPHYRSASYGVRIEWLRPIPGMDEVEAFLQFRPQPGFAVSEPAREFAGGHAEA